MLQELKIVQWLFRTLGTRFVPGAERQPMKSRKNTMKTKPFLIVSVVTAAIVTACDRDQPPPSTQTTVDSANATLDAAAKTRDEFLASMDKKMTDLDAKIDRLASQSATASGDAKLRADRALADLQAQRDAVRKEYKELKASTGDTWDKTKAAFQSAWDGLVKAYDDAASKLSSS
jgi:Skp family chaperone for outer membrane proteins